MHRYTALLAAFAALGCSNGGLPSQGGASASGGGSAAQAGAAGLGGFAAVAGAVGAGGVSSVAGRGAVTAGVGGSGSPVDVGLSVLERNGDHARSAHFVRPLLTHETVKKFFFELGFKSTFVGDVRSPLLYLEQGPTGHGVVFVTTTSNDVHALDAKTGEVVWSVKLGSAPPAGSVACAGTDSFGIAGTPVIDPVTRTLFVAAAVGQATLERHEVHAISVDDGSERVGFPIDVASLAKGFVASQQRQTSALSLVGGVLYVAYGGAAACAEQRGWVFALDTRKPDSFGVWSGLGAGAGVDAPGGMASDGEGLFVATNISRGAEAARGDSQELLRLTGMALAGSPERDVFYPARWSTMNQVGAELGASNPLLLEVAGATPESYVATLASDGHLALVDRQNLGSANGSVDFVVARGSPSAIKTAPTTYRTSKGRYLALTANSGVTCPVGSPAPPAVNTGQVVVSIRLDAGAPARPQIAWCYYLIAGQGAPVSTSTDGASAATVWFMDDVKLLGLDGDTGQVLFDGGHDVSGVPFEDRTCPGVAPFTSPIALDNRLMIAGKGRLCAWAPR